MKVLRNYFEIWLRKMEKILCLSFFSFFALASAATCNPPWESIGDNCYYFSDDVRSWNSARDYCKILGGDSADLAVFDLACEDYHAIFQRLTNLGKSFAWVGGSDIEVDNYWLWVDGRTMDLKKSYWDNSRPDPNSAYDCSLLDATGAGRWRVYDFSCGNSFNFICQQGLRRYNIL